ncbi:RNA polymerase subunit sigma [Streptomyces pseudogriseolus]|uniref:RNA polymerase subunit sigma n=1 Tax=Streptomyces pseudogriseolus TaxID=36817 RepID=UPI003FA2B2AB|nr:RNA polymerase subunit sigma [Streptomyces pseudogriseolus]
MDRVDDGSPLADLLDERRHLVTLAHRILGSLRDAEGAVDECYRRWYALSGRERERIAAPRSWLADSVGGICLARLALPGPGPGPGSGTGTGTGTGAEDVVPAVPDVIVARPHVMEPTTLRRHDAVVHAVRRACVTADQETLLSLLAPDASAFFDGGGKIRTLVEPVHGRDRVARSLLRLLDRRPHTTTLTAHSVNGRTGLVVRHDRRVVAVMSLEVAGAEVVRMWVVVNPDKLRHWNTGRP